MPAVDGLYRTLHLFDKGGKEPKAKVLVVLLLPKFDDNE
jgi:hypothetical protein